jgi:hypothetical protein
MRIAHNLMAAVLLLSVPAPALAQSPPPPLPKTISLGGPRIGFTSLSPGVIEKLRENHLEVRPLMTQFGWQFERQFYSKGSALAALSEWSCCSAGWSKGLRCPA